MARSSLGHEIGHCLRLIHDTVDALGGVVKQLSGTINGSTLHIAFAAIEEKTEEQRKGHRDDEHDEKA